MAIPFIDVSESRTISMEEEFNVVKKLRRKVKVCGLVSTDFTILSEALDQIPGLISGSFLAVPPSRFAMLILVKRNPSIIDENTVEIDLEYEDFLEGYNQDLTKIAYTLGGSNPETDAPPPKITIYGETRTSVQQTKTNFYWIKPPDPAIDEWKPNTAYAVGDKVDYMGFYWIAQNVIGAGQPRPGDLRSDPTNGLGGQIILDLTAIANVVTSSSTVIVAAFSKQPNVVGILTAVVNALAKSSGPPIPVAIIAPATGPTLNYNATLVNYTATSIGVSGTGFDAGTIGNNKLTANGLNVGNCTGATTTSATFALTPIASVIDATPLLGDIIGTIKVSGVSSNPAKIGILALGSPFKSVDESTASLPIFMTSISINGHNFNTDPSKNPVKLTLGVSGKCVAATATTMTINFDAPPIQAGPLHVQVGTYVLGVATYDDKPIKIGNVFNEDTPTITEDHTVQRINVTSLTINGSGFNATAGSTINWKIAQPGVDYTENQSLGFLGKLIRRQIMVGHVFPDGSGSGGPRDEQFAGVVKFQSGEITIPQPQENYTVKGRIYITDPQSFEDTLTGAISELPWRGKAAHTWLISEVKTRPMYIEKMYAVTIEFQYNEDTWLPTAVFNDQRTGRPPANLVSGFGFRSILRSPADLLDFDAFFNATFK